LTAVISTSAVPRASPPDAAGEVVASLSQAEFDNATDVVVVDGERFVGIVPLEPLLAAAPARPVSDLVQQCPAVAPDEDVERAAREAAYAGTRVVAVVDDGRFAGLIGPQQLLQTLEQDHEEDLARLGGYQAGAAMATQAARESLTDRLRHRMPWLTIGLAGAMASAVIVSSFEEALQREVLLAFFMPAVVYMADAVGTQTETVVIRGLAVGVSMRQIVPRELATGLITGGLIGVTFYVFARAIWGNDDVAAAVAISIAISCSIATVVAMALPAVFSRLGTDPAYGSGPLATVIQDLLSITVYFLVADALV
jgi:magnesium transporter